MEMDIHDEWNGAAGDAFGVGTECECDTAAGNAFGNENRFQNQQ